MCGKMLLLFIIVGTKFMIIMFKLANVRVNREKSAAGPIGPPPSSWC